MKDHGQNPDKGIKAGAAPVSFNEVEKLTEAKYTIQKYKRILFYVVICVLLAAFLLGQYIYPSERETVTEESITYTGTFYRVLADGTVRQVYFYCVDISEFAVNKLSDRGSLSARGIVTNVQDFIVHLSKELIQP